MKNWLIGLGILIVLIMIFSPFAIYFIVKSEVEWLGFFASYLGGIFGGIISGGLTLGGVYLTLEHKDNLARQENAEKISYVLGKLTWKFITLNDLIDKNEKQLSTVEQVKEIRKYANIFLKTIDDNRHVAGSDLKFIKHIEFLTGLLKDITNYTFIKTAEETLKDFETRNEQIQISYKQLEEYVNSFYKRQKGRS